MLQRFQKTDEEIAELVSARLRGESKALLMPEGEQFNISAQTDDWIIVATDEKVSGRLQKGVVIWFAGDFHQVTTITNIVAINNSRGYIRVGLRCLKEPQT